MTSIQFLTSAWTWSPGVLLAGSAATGVYLALFRKGGRRMYFAAALAVFVLALMSPVSVLADGYLFSAHMLQHILLVLVVPALLLMSLPPSFAPRRTILAHPALAWVAGVGAMWIWHVPILCDTAATSRLVGLAQTVSLLAMGALFWWQVLAPQEQDRLPPLAAIAYLFTACTACSVLGIILTFAPVQVCASYQNPVDRLGMLGTIRGSWGFTSDRDQQVGGLLMWVPMCMIYLGAILAQLARWFAAPAPVAATLENL